MISHRKTTLILFFLILLPFSFALDSPNVSSSTHPEGEWSRYEDIIFKWDAVDGANQYCYVLNADSSNSAPDEPCTNNTTVTLPKKISSGDYYFHIKAKTGVAESPATTYHIKLDIRNPPRPQLTATANQDGTLKLTWEVEDDDASGIKEFEVFRNLMGSFSIRDVPVLETVSGGKRSFTDDKDLEQNRTYHYKIRATDNAGNTGTASNEVRAQTVAECDLDISFTVFLSSDESTLELGISSGEEKIYHGGLKAALPGNSKKTFFEEAEPFSDWNGSLDLSQLDEGFIDFTLSAKEFFGDPCDQDKRFVYDVTKPSVAFVFPKYNDRVSGTVPIQVRAEDKGPFKSGFKEVAIHIKENGSWEKIGAAEGKGDEIFELEWDSFDVDNGSYGLKVTVEDSGGNKAEAAQNITVINAFEGSVDINGAIEQALAAREEALEKKWGLASKAIVSEYVDRLLAEGNANFSEGERLADLNGLENETNAKVSFAQAIIAYNQARDAVTTSVYQTADFVFNKEQVGILLAAAGISGGMADQAIRTIERDSPTRQLQILLVEDNNSTYYKALIVVSFTPDQNTLFDNNREDDVMQVIELVPKEFAEYAAELDSNISFTILNDDPKLSFVLTKAEYNKTRLVYGLKDSLTQQQADDLISENVINKFVAPPVMLPVEGAGFGFGLDFGQWISTDLVLIAFALVLLAMVVLAVLVVLKRKGKLFKKGSRGSPLKHAAKFASKKEKKKPKEKKTEPGEKKPKKPFGGLKIPKFGKKSKSPLSVFGGD